MNTKAKIAESEIVLALVSALRQDAALPKGTRYESD